MGRLNKIEYYLRIAQVVSERGTCLRRVYGAVIVKNDEIIATGYNGAPRGSKNCCDSGVCERQRLGVKQGEHYELCKAVHAEQNCLISASRSDVIGSTLYLTGIDVESGNIIDAEPCMLCARMLINAGVHEVIGRTVDGGYKVIDLKKAARIE